MCIIKLVNGDDVDDCMVNISSEDESENRPRSTEEKENQSTLNIEV